MLCATCRRQVAQGAVCATCGMPAPGAGAPLELVLADGTHVPIVRDLTIGRSRASGLWMDDPSVSRNQARIEIGRDGVPLLTDAGSTYGTFLDDARVQGPVALRAGSRLRIGNQLVGVEARADDNAAGRTIVVPIGASLLMPSVGSASLQPAETAHGRNPRLRSGYALKRLDASEGERRWIVRDLHGKGFLRISDRDAELFRLLDGTLSLADLVHESEIRFGEMGAVRLARLLADLGDRGMLAGIEGAAAGDDTEPQARWRRLIRTRERAVEGVGPFFDRVYRAGGWVLFTRPALYAMVSLAIVGFCIWIALIAARYGTPFVVADKLLLGGLVFLIGRGLLVAMHELAHGLAMESVGRRVNRAGLKTVFVFPYAFVDTSEVWFEPQRRRAAVSAAGPLSDVTIAGAFALICLLLPAGSTRDVAFQVAFAGYVAAFFNLNPFLERDGYHIVADRLGVAGLRAKAREELRRRLSGEPVEDPDPALIRYAVAGLVWSFIAAVIVIVMSMRYQPIMVQYAPPTVVWIVFATLWVAAFVPVLIVVAPPLRARFRGPKQIAAAEG